MRSLLAPTAIAACVAACSAESAPEEKGSLPADGLVAEASATTRQELGVAYWVLEHEGTGDLNGYDGDLRVQVTFQHQEQAREDGTMHAYVFKDAEGSARVVLMQDTTGATVAVLESTLEGKYQRIGELMSADLRTLPHGKASAASDSSLTSKSVVQANSLQPLSPTDCQGSSLCLAHLDHCRLINDQCVAALGNYRDAAPAQATYCPIYKDANKLTNYCRAGVAKGTYNGRTPSPFEACVGDITATCKDAEYAAKTAGGQAKQCADNQEVKDCRKDLGYDPLPAP